MNLQQRQSSDEADLEITAELPVLDVAAYESNVAATEAAGDDTSATVSIRVLPEREPLGSTDTWNIPSPSLRVARTVSSEAANTVIDENRARLEVNLQALSTTLRDVEERLTRKGERLIEIERALDMALAERSATEKRARALTEEVARAEAATHAAQARISELQKVVADREAADATRRARDAETHAQLLERNSQFQVQLTANSRAFEAKFATHAQTVARVERELGEARALATGYLETLQSNEGRRSVFEELIATLDDGVDQRDARISRLETDLAAHTGRVGELESDLRERVARIAILEATVSRQTVAAAQLRSELERSAAGHSQLMSGAASLEAALQAATSRGDQQEAVARAAQSRIEEFEAATPAQRRRVEQLEAEVATIRAELQSSISLLQTAGVERNEHMARLAAGDARILELEARVADQQDAVRQLQAEANASVARAKELEGDLRAAEETIHRLEADARNKTARVEELEKINHEWRATVEEARHAITDRDGLIERLEQETAASAVLVGHIQKSITRLDNGAEHIHEPAPDGATRLLIRTDGETEVVHVLGRKTSVGRTPDNDLQIDAKFISRHHAVILAGPAHAIIEDLNSTNGVMVNNRRITRQPLKDGDNVVIGKTQFRFVVRAARAMS